MKKIGHLFIYISSQRNQFTLWADNCDVQFTDEATTGSLFNEEGGEVKYLN